MASVVPVDKENNSCLTIDVACKSHAFPIITGALITVLEACLEIRMLG